MSSPPPRPERPSDEVLSLTVEIIRQPLSGRGSPTYFQDDKAPLSLESFLASRGVLSSEGSSTLESSPGRPPHHFKKRVFTPTLVTLWDTEDNDDETDQKSERERQGDTKEDENKNDDKKNEDRNDDKNDKDRNDEKKENEEEQDQQQDEELELPDDAPPLAGIPEDFVPVSVNRRDTWRCNLARLSTEINRFAEDLPGTVGKQIEKELADWGKMDKPTSRTIAGYLASSLRRHLDMRGALKTFSMRAAFSRTRGRTSSGHQDQETEATGANAEADGENGGGVSPRSEGSLARRLFGSLGQKSKRPPVPAEWISGFGP